MRVKRASREQAARYMQSTLRLPSKGFMTYEIHRDAIQFRRQVTRDLVRPGPIVFHHDAALIPTPTILAGTNFKMGGLRW
jgi:hypothetical protein